MWAPIPMLPLWYTQKTCRVYMYRVMSACDLDPLLEAVRRQHNMDFIAATGTHISAKK